MDDFEYSLSDLNRKYAEAIKQVEEMETQEIMLNARVDDLLELVRNIPRTAVCPICGNRIDLT